MRKLFEVYGIGMELSGTGEPASDLIQRISEDFAFFQKDALNGTAHLAFELLSGAMPRPVLTPAFSTRMCHASGWLSERVCDYGQGTFVFSRKTRAQRIFQIAIGERELAYEALYSAVLSALGEELDRRGFHRVHALGIEKAGVRALVLLPMGRGKSAVAALMHRDPDVRIFSDESPLIRGTCVFPFPVRGALRPEVAQALGVEGVRVFRRKLFPEKLLIPFDLSRVGKPARVDWVLVGVGGAASVRRSFFSKFAAFLVLFDSCVIGRGLAQMAEYLLRVDSLWKLPKTALQRLFSVILLLSRARTGWILISDDARQNARALSDFLSESRTN